MTTILARLRCDICGKERTVPRKNLRDWEHLLEVRKGYRIKPVDICPKCKKNDLPPDRVFLGAVAIPSMEREKENYSA